MGDNYEEHLEKVIRKDPIYCPECSRTFDGVSRVKVGRYAAYHKKGKCDFMHVINSETGRLSHYNCCGRLF